MQCTNCTLHYALCLLGRKTRLGGEEHEDRKNVCVCIDYRQNWNIVLIAPPHRSPAKHLFCDLAYLCDQGRASTATLRTNPTTRLTTPSDCASCSCHRLRVKGANRTMALPPVACCTLPPVSSDYQAQGTEFSLGDLKIYETKDKSAKSLLICVYDIFGFHPNTKQFADKLNSDAAFRVAMPDFFRGEPFNLDNFPPNDPKEIMEFVSTKGSWENVVKRDLLNVIEHYKKEGVTSFGVFGFCWGGKMSIQAVSELDDIKASALLHPAFLQNSDAETVKHPVMFLPSKDEPDLIPMYEIVKRRLGDENAAHHRFEDMFHGFAAARGDWKDELQRKRADEAILLVHDFMKKHLHK